MSPSGGSDRGRRALGVVAVAIAVVAGLGAGLVFWFLTLINCVDGDGGVPYVARSSTQADFCGATGDGTLILVIAAAAVAGLAVVASRAWGEWRLRRGPATLAIALTVAVAAAPPLAFAAFNLPANDCSDEQEAENDEWQRQGGVGDPPHDCEHY